MGEISVRPIFHGFIRSGPDGEDDDGEGNDGLNPVEIFWGWLRKKLRSMDLEDMRKKRRLLGKTAYTARVNGGAEVGQGLDGGEERGR